MRIDLHERARLLIALSGQEEIAAEEQVWLAAHLQSCASCREFAENSREIVRSLRATSVTATAGLVFATQMRVHQRAQELQHRQERFWTILVCCAAVTLCTAFTTAILWRGFAWIGQQVQLSAPVWEAGLAVFCLMPAILTGILLLSQGTYFASHDGS